MDFLTSYNKKLLHFNGLPVYSVPADILLMGAFPEYDTFPFSSTADLNPLHLVYVILVLFMLAY